MKILALALLWSVTAHGQMAAALEGEVVDKALAGYAVAENGCAGAMDVLNALKPVIAARPAKPEYRWTLAWVAVSLAESCSYSNAGALLKEAVAQLTELKNAAKVVAPVAAGTLAPTVWSQATEALVRSSHGDHSEALRLSVEVLRGARSTPLVMITRAMVLWNHGRYELAKTGEVTAALRSELQEATGLLSEALRGDLPKSASNLVNLAQGRIQFLLGDMVLAAQYLRAYTVAETKNARAFAELSDALYRADDCVGAKDFASKSVQLHRSRQANLAMEHANSCAESKAAAAESSAAARGTASSPAGK